MNHSSSSLILVFTTPLYLTVICIIGLHLAQPVTAIAAAKHLKDFRPFSKQFGVPASPLPCKLRLDDPLCPFEDNFQKFDRNFWIRANNFSKKPTTIYSCWMSKSNAKKIRKKKAPEGIVKLKVKNKENIFENTFIPFSCGEIFSRKRFGVGCYEAVMKPSLIFSLRAEMTLWANDLTNGIREDIANLASLRIFRNQDKLQLWTTAATDVEFVESRLHIPSFRPEKKMFRYGIKWTKSRIEYYAERELLRVIDTADLSNFVGPLRIDFAVYTQKNGSLLGPDYQYEKNSDLRIQSIKYTPGESCSFG